MRTLFLTAVFLIALPASAAVLSVTPKEISSDGETLVSVVIDTEGEVINALEMDIALPEEDARITEIHEGTSVVSFWTSAATIQNSAMTLSGIIPGGFQGEGTVVSFLVSGRREGTARILIENVSVLRNDGKGTSIPTRVADTTLSLSPDAAAQDSSKDTTPPEPFSIAVVSDTSVEGGVFVAIFATQDKQTGVASYEIQETREFFPDGKAWVPAKSPYILSDQSLSGSIFVRATDYAGNSRIERFETEGGISVLEGSLYLMVSLVVVLLLFAFYVRRSHRKKAGLSNV